MVKTLAIQALYFGLALWMMNMLARRINKFIIRQFGWDSFVIFGTPGTWFHEAAHAVTARLFGIRVEEFSPCHFDRASGILGYVKTRVDQSSKLQTTGFILSAIAPLPLGLLFLYLLSNMLIPNVVDLKQLGIFALERLPEANFGESCTVVGLFVSTVLGSLQYPGFWLFSVTSLLICAQIVPSLQDLKMMLPGILAFALILAFIGHLPKLHFMWPKIIKLSIVSNLAMTFACLQMMAAYLLFKSANFIIRALKKRGAS